MTWVDTHAHLYTPEFDPDLDAVIARARDAGVSRIIIPAEDLPTSEAVVKLAQTRENLHCAVGMHPQKAAEFSDGVLAQIEALCSSPKVVAVGEIGFDYYWQPYDRGQQLRCFEAFMELALRVQKPVIIHNRNSDADVLAALEKYAVRGLKGVMHCFSSGLDVALRCLDLGFYISFAGQVSYPKAGPLREVARQIMHERILVETDSPYLSPQERRGKRNEPAHIVHTGEFLAKLLGMDAERLAELTTANALRLFGLGG